MTLALITEVLQFNNRKLTHLWNGRHLKIMLPSKCYKKTEFVSRWKNLHVVHMKDDLNNKGVPTSIFRILFATVKRF